MEEHRLTETLLRYCKTFYIFWHGIFFTFLTLTFRPMLSRSQTIEEDCHSCCSDELVTVLEIVPKKVKLEHDC